MNFDWKLIPSVKRSPYDKEQYEQCLTTDFYIETKRRRINTPNNKSGWLSLMQHYGLQTRLLDWSGSPSVALYFATENYKYSQTDGALWVLNPELLNELQGYKKYLFPMDYNTPLEFLEEAFYPTKAKDKIIACCNVEYDLRMYVQQANFTIHDSNIPLKKYRLRKIFDKN